MQNAEPDTVAKPEIRYRVSARDIASDGVLIYKIPMVVAVEGENALPSAATQKHGSEAWEVEASGDGACGVHALFGTPCGHGRLHCADARELIRSHLQKPLLALRDLLGCEVVDKVCSCIWDDFVVKLLKWCDGSWQGAPTCEQRLFWEVFQGEAFADAREAAHIRHVENEKQL